MTFCDYTEMNPSSALARPQGSPPAPFGRWVLWLQLALVLVLLAWAAFGRLDIVAVAHGKLVPLSRIKIVQPAEAGVVTQIFVQEGETVKQGQVLMQMDAVLSDADEQSLRGEVQRQELGLRRIDAELAGQPPTRRAGDPADLFEQVQAQYVANRLAYQSALDAQQAVLDKSAQDLAAANETLSKLQQVLPHYREQETAFAQLGRDGFAGRLVVADKQRERIETEQDLKAQAFAIQSAEAAMRQAGKQMSQIRAEYRRVLQAERSERAAQADKLRQELAKQQHRQALLALRAPQDGVVKDLATRTVGTVTAPGTVLLTLVPLSDPLQAEVWVSNEDIGFVHPSLPARIKVGAYTFQKYGMLQGVVSQVSADASEAPLPHGDIKEVATQPAYKAVLTLDGQRLVADGRSHTLSPGMQVSAEILLGTRTVLEYVLSPVRGAFQEAARER
ncbi:MAG: HlyD family type I secretion periplasmic adaptor subunit [Thiobacillus sp.]|nr:HlyD family type I secretion periplasmic adaptor subunit [Thiobacillus sp.]